MVSETVRTFFTFFKVVADVFFVQWATGSHVRCKSDIVFRKKTCDIGLGLYRDG